MNVFILCAGRCGSVTLARAFGYADNYSVGHESRSGILGPDRLDYPLKHIEADPRLAWYLGRLDRKYGRGAFYVHLKRDSEATAASHARKLGRPQPGTILASHYMLAVAAAPRGEWIDLARDYVDTVTANIELFLADKPRKRTFQIERWEVEFPSLWDAIGSEGNLSEAMKEFETRHNASC